MKKPQFIPAFIIYKEGTTKEPIKIMRDINEPYNVGEKMNFYLSLGYRVELIIYGALK